MPRGGHPTNPRVGRGGGEEGNSYLPLHDRDQGPRRPVGCPSRDPPVRPLPRALASAPGVGAGRSGLHWIPLPRLHLTVALAGSRSAGVAAQTACTCRDRLALLVSPGALLPPVAALYSAPDVDRLDPLQPLGMSYPDLSLAAAAGCNLDQLLPQIPMMAAAGHGMS
ncbi:uncharacterized protein NFIA_024090 [Aspergillus fischeri NRRL 181]|uniref:Uncharacterized protein n=1 Tax=Neosartorya fischeri (strain ATCC 1020 / DSM 3700 / CBS 544.65 / FGSC A1164 / JCM 1740 / NRRL 181 / WB 181) TaxID=331117 RepID=A1D5H6_NEOFI|nr:uncharacterized protein NFIA_024090 [Aspergillus fischeri NRRL 181]EAW22030.1 hypothetical protein NFIA_024090 [Aspergillus fischeri NRRL 181]